MRIFCILMLFVIPIIMAFAGWMMQAHPSKNINGLIGYRTKRSMKNMETWKFAHAYCGRLWKIYGIVMFCISVVLSVFFLFMKVETDIVLMGVVVCLQSLILILPILFTERALQQQFDENGNQKK
ncbi:MAG: SdpI family protein [Ruminococcus callidus]|nr:SdpI family protein [Ruminococcus callidus]